ncbi:TIGR03032 family protein [Novipirellula artificiosorum]|uniref:Conserved hypothetical protein CHP03032 domain-containing protein n=1 Tax=Novipirellula artificiosorum TaxID=2528016 RepID=A0A5C6DFV4_9BACT|nr:TIGR03032 family protein [Novipirellula artificiosorum]TWU33869.1 hypothetical protein Poly41_48690 [Novipirellula artificiosorum]
MTSTELIEKSVSNDDAEAGNAAPFQFVHSEGFAELLEALGGTLFVTTYQAGKLVAFRACDGHVSMLMRSCGNAMGLAVRRDRIAVGGEYQIWTLRNSPEVAAKMKPAGQHDACFLPRSSHVTGDIDVHEIAWGTDDPRTTLQQDTGSANGTHGETPQLWVVNTLFSCLCTLDPDYSFVPRWKPRFISEIKRQDRCHLNGMAMVDGRPKYVTAFGETDTPEGWRPGKADGGVVIDVDSGETVARGFAMPHSPRVHNGRLWVLDSGRGRLVTVDPAKGQTETVAQSDGYARGLAFAGPLAFIGQSQIRETAIFGGVPIAEGEQKRPCGVTVVDTRNGQIVGSLEFEATVQELFDVQLLTGVRFPAVVGFDKDTIRRACVIAPETRMNQPAEDSH